MRPSLRLADGRLAGFDALKQGPLAKVWGLLEGDGEQARLVGGAVRDLLLGHAAKDFDLATTAAPDAVMARAKAAGLKVVPTGVEHGTVTVLADGRPFEVTTLRRDIVTDGRRATVAFGRSFAQDAERRDFTINALSVDAMGRVHDTVGGIADLAAGRVRFIGDARTRVREDYLRILRFFRFSATYSTGPLDAHSLGACIAGRDGLQALSRERVRAELLKLLAAPRAGEITAEAAEAGLLQGLLGGACDPARLKKLIAVVAARDAAPDPLLCLAALALRIVEDAESLAIRLRLSNAEADRLRVLGEALPDLHGLEAPPGPGALRALLFLRGRRCAIDALTLAHVDSRAAPNEGAFLAAARFLADTPEPVMPVRGADVQARGIAEGREVGRVLKDFQALWIRAGFPKEPGALARLLDEALRAAKFE